MATLLKCGALFLHIPKAGGNWVSDVLEEQGLVFANVGGCHATREQLVPFEQFLRASAKYDRPNRPLFTFCFVRNPRTWYESWYQHMNRKGWVNWADEAGHWYPGVRLDGFGPDGFDEFVARVLDQRPGFVTDMYGAYLNHGMHFVGRQEHLADDLVTVLRFLNVPFDEERLREYAPVNSGDGTRLRWRPTLLEAVERAEYSAFERFGYATELFQPPGAGPRRRPQIGFAWGDCHRIPLNAPFEHEQGYGWRRELVELGEMADILHDPYRSPVVLLEDGRPLPSPHALHDDIRTAGRGRYSHWTKWLLFSTSDNSNPNTNGRCYELAFTWNVEAARDALVTTAYTPSREDGRAAASARPASGPQTRRPAPAVA